MKQGWEYKRFSEIFDLQMGRTPARDKKSYWEGDNLWVSIGDMGDCKYISHTKESISDIAIKEAKMPIVPPDTALMSFKLSIGKTAITSKHLCTNEAIMAFIPKEGIEVSSEFLYYYLSHYKWEGNRAAMGKTINKKIISDAIISLPPLSEQQSIVAELDKINEIIDLKKAQLKDLDLLAQSIFYDMFGDPIENPKGWEVKRWEETFDTKLGKMLDKAKQDVSGKELPYLANCNVKWGYFDLENLRTMFFSNTEIDKFSLKKGDLLLCEGGESGRCAIWNNTDRQILFQKAIHRARLKNNQVADVVYIRYFMEYFRLAGGLKDYLSKATIEHLTGEKLKKVKLPLPPLSLQQSFASKIQAIESQKSAIKQSLADVETLLASRMDYYFN